MAHKLVEDRIEAYLRANWTATPVRTENQTQTPPDDGGPFLTLQFPAATSERWPINQRYYRETGGFRLVLAVPKGQGSTQIRNWSETLSALFCDVKINGINCRAPSPPFMGGGYQEGPYVLSTIVVPYDFNFTRAEPTP